MVLTQILTRLVCQLGLYHQNLSLVFVVWPLVLIEALVPAECDVILEGELEWPSPWDGQQFLADLVQYSDSINLPMLIDILVDR